MFGWLLKEDPFTLHLLNIYFLFISREVFCRLYCVNFNDLFRCQSTCLELSRRKVQRASHWLSVEVCLRDGSLRLCSDWLLVFEWQSWSKLLSCSTGCADLHLLDMLTPVERKRQGYTHELIVTEENYVNDLQLVTEVAIIYLFIYIHFIFLLIYYIIFLTFV